jgi:hypothetical protein
MRKLYEVADQSLKWSQPSTFKNAYELRAGDELIATLKFKSVFGSFATGESADGSWTFKRVGFWQTRATIRAADSETELASFKDKTWASGGTLSMADGRQLRATTNFWSTKLTFQDDKHDPLIVFDNHGILHLSSIVDIRPSARAMPELPWLVMFGWYLSIKMSQDATGAAAAGAAAAG